MLSQSVLGVPVEVGGLAVEKTIPRVVTIVQHLGTLLMVVDAAVVDLYLVALVRMVVPEVGMGMTSILQLEQVVRLDKVMVVVVLVDRV